MINLLAAQYGSISDFEVIWTLIALIGFMFSVYNIREARIDRRVLREAEVKNGRMKIADYSLWLETTRAVSQAIFAIIGFLSMTLIDHQNQSDFPWNVVAIGVAVHWGLIVAATLIMLNSVLAWHLRRELEKKEDEG